MWLGAALILVYAAWQPHDDALPVKLEVPAAERNVDRRAAALCILVVGQFLSVGLPSRLRPRRWSP